MFLKSLLIHFSGMALVGLFALLLLPSIVLAHCDTMDGPVISDARDALEAGEPEPVLKWVAPEYEDEIRASFEKTLKVRAEGPDARELADRYFFETLVRLHRAGEGAPYTGLKPAGAVEPPVTAADKALETGSVDGLVDKVADAVERGIRHRFQEALEAKKKKDESVGAGRKFVHAYVSYVHYVEGLHKTAAGERGHGH